MYPNSKINALLSNVHFYGTKYAIFLGKCLSLLVWSPNKANFPFIFNYQFPISVC